MRTAGIKAGDIIRCDVRGNVFYALVQVVGPEVAITPLDRRVTHYAVTPRQIIEHYRRSQVKA